MSRRAPGEGSIFQRKVDGRWVASLTLADVNGRRRRKQFVGRTQKEVRQRLERARAAADRGIPVRTTSPTVAQLLEDWFRHGVEITDWTPATRHGYRGIMRKYLIPLLGKIHLDKLSTHDVQKMLDQIHADGRAPGTVRNVKVALRSALELAVTWELTSRNAAAKARLPRIERKAVEPLSPDEARQFLVAVTDHRLGPLYTVTTALGLRQSEVVGLRWEDVDLDIGMLEVRQRTYYIDVEFHTGRPKSDRSRRVIPLPDEVAEVLRAHRRRLREERMRAREWTESGLVFPNTTGGPLYGRYLTNTMKQLMVEAGLQPKRFHDLRHTAATLMLAMGVPMETISATLGHSGTRVTDEIYAHVLPSMQRDAADKMGAFLRGAGGL